MRRYNNRHCDGDNFDVAAVVSTVNHPFCRQQLFPTISASAMGGIKNEETSSNRLYESGLVKNVCRGNLGEQEWTEDERRNEELQTTTQISRYNDLVDVWLSGLIQMKDVEDLEKRCKDCCMQRQDADDRVKELMRKARKPKVGVEEKQRNIGTFLELQGIRMKCGELEKHCQFRIALWDDDLCCGFTLHRELENLILERSLRTKEIRITTSLLRDALSENQLLKEGLENLLEKLEQCHRRVAVVDRLSQAKGEESTTIEELRKEIAKLQDAVNEALKRLIEEQMHREIDEIKIVLLIEGFKRRLVIDICNTYNIYTLNIYIDETEFFKLYLASDSI